MRSKTNGTGENQHAGIIEVAAHFGHDIPAAVQAQPTAELVGERVRRLLFHVNGRGTENRQVGCNGQGPFGVDVAETSP